MDYTTIKSVGLETEKLAYIYLKKKFKKVRWISVNYPCYPYDFEVVSKGVTYLIDVKSARNNVVYVPLAKRKRITNGDLPFFRYLILNKKFQFELLTLKMLIKKYKVTTKKNLYGLDSLKAVITISLDVELLKKARKKIKCGSLSAMIEKFLEKEIGR